METKTATLAELTNLKDNDLLKKQGNLNVLLSKDPPNSWVKKHPMASNVSYLPIDKVEFLLTQLFVKWWVDIKTVQQIANSIVTTVRLNYINLVDGKESYQDGIGAAPVHTSKGAGATDFNKVLTDSVMKAAPASESYAIKDAAEKIGNIFGANLNRKDTLIYTEEINNNRFEGAKFIEK